MSVGECREKREESLGAGNWQLAIPFLGLIELVSGSLSLFLSLYLSLCPSSLWLLVLGWCSREWGISNDMPITQSMP